MPKKVKEVEIKEEEEIVAVEEVPKKAPKKAPKKTKEVPKKEELDPETTPDWQRIIESRREG
jgi:hypothetical protein